MTPEPRPRRTRPRASGGDRVTVDDVVHGAAERREVAMPMWARLHLTHAVMQTIADECGADILHLKGPAVAAELRTAPRRSTDVDVLVRPAHVALFLAALGRHGWRLVTGFAEGSPFGHAANYGHPHFAYVDVHRFFPGPQVDPAEAFDTLWVSRMHIELAHTQCAAPDLTSQVLILALHEARSHRARGTFEAWELAGADRQEAVWALARSLDAEVPLAAAVGRLREFRDRRDFPLWRYWSEPESDDPGGDRLSEWKAKLHAARGVREHVDVAASMVRVNRTHLAMELGHEPTPAEIAREYRRRGAAGFQAIAVRLRNKARDRLASLRSRGGDAT